MPDVFHHIDVRVELFEDELVDPLEFLSDCGVYLIHRVRCNEKCQRMLGCTHWPVKLCSGRGGNAQAVRNSLFL